MKIHKYPDGTSYAELNNDSPVDFTYRLNSYEDVIHLIQIIEAFNHSNIIPRVTIPNMIDAQADKRFGENQSSGLKIICRLLNSVNANYKVFHPHNSEVVEALMDDVQIIDNTKFIERVLANIEFNGNHHRDSKYTENLILMSSDAGGFKPLIKLCDKIKWQGETFSASKARSWDEIDGTKFVQQIDKQDFYGKDILIIDDICVYGGTFKGLSKLLKERNCGKIYLAVSHMTIQNLGEDPVTNYFDKVFTTNSKFDNYIYKINDKNHGLLDTLIHPKNLEIIKMFQQ